MVKTKNEITDFEIFTCYASLTTSGTVVPWSHYLKDQIVALKIYITNVKVEIYVHTIYAFEGFFLTHIAKSWRCLFFFAILINVYDQQTPTLNDR